MEDAETSQYIEQTQNFEGAERETELGGSRERQRYIQAVCWYAQRAPSPSSRKLQGKQMAGAKRTRTRVSYPRPTPELEDEMVEWWASHELLYDTSIGDFHLRDKKDKVMQEGCIQFGLESEYHLLFYLE